MTIEEAIESIENDIEVSCWATDIVIEELRRLQKENEELKEVNKLVEKFPVDEMSDDVKLILITKGNFLSNPCYKSLLDDYLSKGKIREKIEKLEYKMKKYTEHSMEYYENVADSYAINILQDLLKEE